MNPVEIEEAVEKLVSEPFDAAEFPFQFLAAFDNPATTIKRLRTGATNQSDLPGGVLQRGHIHIATCAPGEVDATLRALRDSPRTTSAKARFILATDGAMIQAEELTSGETVACAYDDLPDHFGFFLQLAGITTVKEIRESSFDIRATGRLNRLYIQLRQENPEWEGRQSDMNHFMARLIFCFFAEDTDIFLSDGLFTKTVEQMTAGDPASTHVVISEIFRAMDTRPQDRERANLPRYALKFPYVNGHLFSGSTDVPRFSKIARSYLMHIGSLNWKLINPDIFGSMIQAVTEKDERGSLGMHYTSVPNILKVLNPLFLDDLRQQLEGAGTNGRKLLNLRNRMSRIRVFDPACGSGNFLVIAYKEMRGIEAEINKRRGEADRRSDIPLTNFRGIELRDFPAEIARLALIIAEYQCDVLCRGQKEAVADFLPLGSENWITCGNALRLDWLSICPPTGTGVKVTSDDLFQTPLDQAEIDFENEGGETYICGNPPYVGSSLQSDGQKQDLHAIFSDTPSWKNLDYIAGWFRKAAEYSNFVKCDFAFVSTNSICQGQQVPLLWPLLINAGIKISFAYTSFKWANLASQNAGVTVIILGLTTREIPSGNIYSFDSDGLLVKREVSNINPYLVAGRSIIVSGVSRPPQGLGTMFKGNMPSDGGFLILESQDRDALVSAFPEAERFIRPYVGSGDFIRGDLRFCLWIEDADFSVASAINPIARRLDSVRNFRANAKAPTTRPHSQHPNRFVQVQSVASTHTIIIPRHTSERREYLPFGLLDARAIVSDAALAIYDSPTWNMAIIASRLHYVWISTVCGKIKTDMRYSNTLGWNAFPLPFFTAKDKQDLSRRAEDILLVRESHFPATIADLYDPEGMPEDLRRAHEANDEVLERIYIGRRFRNDTERLEKLFELYTRMTANDASGGQKRKPKKPKEAA